MEKQSVSRQVRLLPPAVAERIAAGEVIERPASVVKELVENAIDAGATEVTVLLEDGGKGLIEVLDNGSGMPPADLSLCIERHATSKLQTLDDLERILTLGFRGEALPSIAAVTELSLLSRPRDGSDAHILKVGAIGTRAAPEPTTFGTFLGSPHGTRIQARGIFSQVPARLKFLKSQGAEVAQTRDWIERLAIAHPEVGFRLVSDGRPILTLRVEDEVSRVRSILADGDDYPIVSASSNLGAHDRSAGAFHVRAHWLQGSSSPNSRRVLQIVNGRAVRDRMLQQALLAPFRQALLPGQYPALALYIDCDPAILDVNVHPTKTELRFLDSRQVFRAVQSLIDSLIMKAGAPAFAASESSGLGEWTPASTGSWTPTPAPYMPAHTAAFEFRAPMPSRTPATSEEAFTPGAGGHTASSAFACPVLPSQYVGAIFNTYLAYDLGEELVLIDQHAAHERVRFEKLRAQVLAADPAGPPRQALLIPEAARFRAEDRALAESRLAWFTRLGFEVEVFGDDTLLFRAVPSAWGQVSLRARLLNLVERVLDAELASDAALDEALFEKLASEACHSAVRAGDRLEPEEAKRLVDELFTCSHPWNCPHGRPTLVKVPKARFEEWFQRRV